MIIDTQNSLPSLPKLLWIPSHTGIPLNEKADQLAKEALNLTEISRIHHNPDDFLPTIPRQINLTAQQNWNNTPTFLQTIHPKIENWQSNNQSSKIQETILTRLRIGHTKITHSYITSGQPPPTCPTCNHTRTTVKHILIECQKYNTERQRLIQLCNQQNIIFSIQNILGDDYPLLTKQLFNFIFETGLQNKI